ncbi:unnamed protein product, partial [Vitis vinifera]
MKILMIFQRKGISQLYKLLIQPTPPQFLPTSLLNLPCSNKILEFPLRPLAGVWV